MAIVRHLVDAHGGTIAVESARQGPRFDFTVRLPFRASRGKADRGDRLEAPSTGATVQNIDKARILIVEDDAATRASLTQVLSVRGAEVRSAASAAEAMTVFREFRPGIMVCDVAMPGEDGYSLLTRIRALGPGQESDVRAVALTALAGAEDRRLAAAAASRSTWQSPWRPIDSSLPSPPYVRPDGGDLGAGYRVRTDDIQLGNATRRHRRW